MIINKKNIVIFLLFFTQMSAQTILVTGGAGFVGGNLCKKLYNQGHTIIAVDNLLTGYKKNLQELFGKPRFKFIEHDIIQPLVINQKIDWIFNLASPASPKRYQEDPVHTTKTSVFGIINMLDLAKQHNARILQASTSEVYGDPKQHPQTEDYWGNVNPIGPRACYDEAKRCAETLCFDYHRKYGVQIKVIRIFNTYGPGMSPDDGRVVSNFIMQALQKKPITIYGNGSQTRSFCFVDDLVDGIIAMMETGPEITGPINLGNPDEYTILELAEKVKVMIPGVEFCFKSLPQDDPTKRKPNINRAKQLLNWQPKIALDEGLKRTIEYFTKVIE